MATVRTHGRQAWLVHPAPGRVRTHLAHLHDPSGHFDLSATERELRREAALTAEGQSAVTLAKYPDLRIVLIVLRKGARRVEARTEARVSLQALRGNLEVRLPDGTIDLRAGHLVTLDREVEFHLEARTESAVLLTLAWPRGGTTGARASGPAA
jgi:quercetin dioxygenase-like cupin family protein